MYRRVLEQPELDKVFQPLLFGSPPAHSCGPFSPARACWVQQIGVNWLKFILEEPQSYVVIRPEGEKLRGDRQPVSSCIILKYSRSKRPCTLKLFTLKSLPLCAHVSCWKCWREKKIALFLEITAINDCLHSAVFWFFSSHLSDYKLIAPLIMIIQVCTFMRCKLLTGQTSFVVK